MGISGSRTAMRGRRLNWAITAAKASFSSDTTKVICPALLAPQTGSVNHPDANLQGIIVFIYDIGCPAGCPFNFFLGEHFGRKNMILAGGTFMIIGTILLGSSNALAQLLVGRIVTGIGNGFNSSTIPMYQSELCKSGNKGILLSMQGTVTIVGLCIAYWLDFSMSFVNGPAQWRLLPISFQAFFAICLLLQMLWLPKTLRYPIERDRISEATEILARLQSQDAGIDDPEVLHQRHQIETSIAIESAGWAFRYAELLQGGKIQNLRRIILCCAVNLMQQFTGANMINYYAPVVYATTMSLSRTLSLILGGCTSLTNLFASFIPLWTVERFGRRSLLITSSAGLCFCSSLAAILLSAGTKSAAYGATAMVFLFQIFLGIDWLPIPWLYPSEVETTRIRSRGQALGAFVNWICVFTVVQITPIAIDNIAWRTFIVFAVFCACWVPVVYCFFPETNQLRLEDIDHLFERGGVTGGVFGKRGGRTIEPGWHEKLMGGASEGEEKGISVHRESI